VVFGAVLPSPCPDGQSIWHLDGGEPLVSGVFLPGLQLPVETKTQARGHAGHAPERDDPVACFPAQEPGSPGGLAVVQDSTPEQSHGPMRAYLSWVEHVGGFTGGRWAVRRQSVPGDYSGAAYPVAVFKLAGWHPTAPGLFAAASGAHGGWFTNTDSSRPRPSAMRCSRSTPPAGESARRRARQRLR